MSALLSLARAIGGASSAEYALILAIVGAGIAAAALYLGDAVAMAFRHYAAMLTS